MKKFKTLIATFAVAVVGAFALAPVATVSALDPLDSVCSPGSTSQVCANRGDDSSTLIAAVVNTLLFIVGAIAVVMIIVGGIMYATSTGDAGRVSKAKNTITYSIVGLVVAFLAYAIINWVLNVLPG